MHPSHRVGSRLLLLLLLAAVLNGCGLFGGEEEEDPPAELVKFKPTLKIRQVWSAGIGGGSKRLRLALQPATDGSRVFAAAHDGKVAAFEAEKGKRLWSTKTKLPLSAGPAVSATLVVLGSSNGDVVALNTDNGAELWRVQVSSEVLAAPAVNDELVFVRTVDGKLLALQASDGSQAWFVQQDVPRLSVRGTGSPVIAGNAVIAGFDNGHISAYESGSGSVLWDILLNPPSGRTEIERLSDLNSTVTVVGDDLYVAAYQGSLSSLAQESGQTLWSREVSSYNGAAADFINVYVSDQFSELHAMSRRSGREAWKVDILRQRDVTGPAVVGNSVVVADFEGYVHWFDASSGALQARMKAGGKQVTAAPLVVGNTVYVLNEAGKLYAFRERPAKK